MRLPRIKSILSVSNAGEIDNVLKCVAHFIIKFAKNENIS